MSASIEAKRRITRCRVDTLRACVCVPLHLSLVPLLVPLILLYLYGLTTSSRLRLLLFALSPVPLAIAALAMFVHPAGEFAAAVLVAGVRANLALAAILLPFLILLLIMRCETTKSTLS